MAIEVLVVRRGTSPDLTTSVLGLRGRRAQPAADFGEKFPFGGRETFHTSRDDLVEHAIDLGIRPRIGLARPAGLPPLCRWRDAGASTDTRRDRKSTRLNSSHRTISYAVF